MSQDRYWRGGGLTPLRAAAAEAVAADLSWADDQGALWTGGHARSADVVGEIRRDAKVVRRVGDNVILCRWGGRPFDEALVDRITLVDFAEATTGWNVEDGTVRGEIDAEIAFVWDVPTGRLNALFPPPGRYRNVEVPVDELLPYRTWPRDPGA